MARLSLQYIAGYVDGEGYIGLVKRTSPGKSGIAIRPVVQIGNTHLETLKKIKEVFPNSWLTEGVWTKRQTKASYTLKFGTMRQVIGVLSEITPYLVEKKGRAEIVLKWCRGRIGKRKLYTNNDWKIYESLKVYKNREVTSLVE